MSEPTLLETKLRETRFFKKLLEIGADPHFFALDRSYQSFCFKMPSIEQAIHARDSIFYNLHLNGSGRPNPRHISVNATDDLPYAEAEIKRKKIADDEVSNIVSIDVGQPTNQHHVERWCAGLEAVAAAEPDWLQASALWQKKMDKTVEPTQKGLG